MESTTIFLLVQIAGVFLIVNIMFTVVTFLRRKLRKNKFRHIEEVFARNISTYLYPSKGMEITFLEVQRALRAAGVKEEKRANVQFLIRLMIRTQRALAGAEHQKLRLLYRQIPPYRASISKLKSKDWFEKARGIREIYEMDQRRYLPEIISLRDHHNVYVRREAQIALVVFLGGESLRFLPYLTRRISLWQQIKVVEKLEEVCKKPNLAYLRRAYNSSNPDALQLIIRIIKKYRLHAEAEFLFAMLAHSNFEVREAAIYCLLSLGVDNPLLASAFEQHIGDIPSDLQQRQVRKYLEKSAAYIERDGILLKESPLESA